MENNSKITILDDGKLLVEDAVIVFKNFSGKPDEYNVKGDRKFTLRFFDHDMANTLKDLGWNVSIQTPRQDEEVSYKLNVTVAKNGKRLPIIRRHIAGNEFLVDESTVNELDVDWIEHADLIINPYEYKPGHLSAYVYQMDVTIKESRDFFAQKYGRM